MSIDVSMLFGKPGEATQQSGGSGGGITITSLWENPNPTSNFAAQSIPIDLSNYQYFGVHFRWSNTNPLEMPVQIFTVDENQKMIFMVVNNYNRTGGRTVTYSAANKELSFAAAYYNGSASNAVCIPLNIYGIKV